MRDRKRLRPVFAADNISVIESEASHNRHEPELNETVAGRYRLERLLARGGMGEVYAAIDKSTNERVALKRTLTRDGRERATIASFMREYHALSQLRHPRIIAVYDYGLAGERPYYTMELLDGQDLRELSPVPFREACRYLRDVASSLALLHARRLLHRDLSPRNVRRTSDGRCKLLDFGAMVPFGVPPNLTGTPPCIAPEALQGGPLDQRSDLYSLGAIAYFMLTGKYAHPVSELSALPRVWKQPLVRPMKIARDVPEALDELVIALLSMDPMQRPASAAEVIDRLSAAAELEAQDDFIAARSFLTGSVLLGRDRERKLLQKQVSRTLRGRGGAVLVRGESGAGKSRMLAETALLGQTNGLTVVRTVARARAALASLAGDLVHGIVQAAPLEAQRASAQRPQVLAQPLAADSSEARTQLLAELATFVQEVARERPLLITVDDLERADEFSASFIAALAYQSSDCPLNVVASCDSREQAPLLASVPGLAETLALEPIDGIKTHQLAASLFGDVPNLERVSDWLYRVAAGNPKLTLQLAEHLLNQGVVRYVDGTWVLPTEVTLQLPPGAAQALLLRLEAVGTKARALAELLCVSRAGAPVERILELAQDTPSTVFGALEELVSAGVLDSAGDAYVFAQDALRESLLRTLEPEHRRNLHSDWAERLLRGAPDRDDQLEAGWHLVHTADELRGADILASIAPDLVEQRMNMAVAVPALERALEIYERNHRPIAQQLRIRSLLAMSSFLFDHRLADRYADSTLDLLYPFTGLALVERWSRKLNKQLAFGLALCWTFVRWLFAPRATRGPHVLDALLYYGRAAMGLMGLRALAVDPEGTGRLLERLRPFDGSIEPLMRMLHALAKAIHLSTQGRGADIAELIDFVIGRLDKPRFSFVKISGQERDDLLSGALLLEGVNQCFRIHSQALSYARRLEELGTPLAIAAALRISLSYHALRGETERAANFRRQLDLNAIQSGTVWQVDWIAVPIEGLAAITWSDLVMLRRSLDALDKMSSEVPSFANMRDTMRVGYHFRRADYAAAVRFGEEYMKAHPPFTLLGWATTYAQIALSYLELGQIERAYEICSHARSLVSDHHLTFVIHNSILEAAYATILAARGERERGESLFRALMQRLRSDGEFTRAFLMHEYWIKVTRLVGDRPALLAAIQDMREAALASGNPSAILLADSVCERRARSRSSPLPPAKGETPETSSVTHSEATLVSTFLQRQPLLQQRAQLSLQMLGQYAISGEGYLFELKQGQIELLASLGQREPPAGLTRLLHAIPANDNFSQRMLNDGAQGYLVVRLYDAAVSCIGMAALHVEQSQEPSIPEGLIADIGRALAAAAG